MLEQVMGPSGLSLSFLLPVIAVGERLGTPDGFDVITSVPLKSPVLGPLDIAARESAWEEGDEIGAGTLKMNAASWRFQPLRTSLGHLAILGVARDDGRNPIEEKNTLLYRSLINQASLACERLHLENLGSDRSLPSIGIERPAKDLKNYGCLSAKRLNVALSIPALPIVLADAMNSVRNRRIFKTPGSCR